jgi:hypothetical protein
VRELLSIGLLLLSASASAADDAPFGVQQIPSEGRSVAAELADFDGDGRVDLLQAVVFDMPPSERRLLRVYLQRADGQIPERYDLEVPVPEASAAYDVANVDGAPGNEVLLLQPRGVSILAFSRDDGGALVARTSQARIPDGLTMAAGSDERGLDRLALANFAFGPEPRLVVPGIGETFVLSPSGAVNARIRGGVRANYFIQPPGPFLTESDIQAFVDSPRISVGDVDGDGRADIVASTRHELRLFFQRADGSYGRDADRRIALERVSMEDHIRGSGSVRSAARDIDGDGLLDLLLSLTKGSVMSSSSNSYVYLNHGSGWKLDTPDASFESAETVSADQLIDLDGDGRLELVRMGIKISVLELVEIFVQRALDAWLTAYALVPEAGVSKPDSGSPQPMFTKKVAVQLDFETSRRSSST